jgi:hypothetical protein
MIKKTMIEDSRLNTDVTTGELYLAPMLDNVRYPFNRVPDFIPPDDSIAITVEELVDMEDENVDTMPDEETLENAVHRSIEEAIQHANEAVRDASQDLEDEVSSMVDREGDIDMPDGLELESCDIEEYVSTGLDSLAHHRDQRPTCHTQDAAASVLTGFVDREMRKRVRLTVEEEDRRFDLTTCSFNLDIDSAHCSFSLTDNWPFKSTERVQLWPVGPFSRRQIGTSKFRIDPSGEGTELNWNQRVNISLSISSVI